MVFLKPWLSIFSCVGVVWYNTISMFLFEVGNLPMANKGTKENKNLYQCIRIKWPYSAYLKMGRYSHINFHKSLAFATRLFLHCHSKASISWGLETLIFLWSLNKQKKHFLLFFIYLNILFQNKNFNTSQSKFIVLKQELSNI